MSVFSSSSASSTSASSSTSSSNSFVLFPSFLENPELDQILFSLSAEELEELSRKKPMKRDSNDQLIEDFLNSSIPNDEAIIRRFNITLTKGDLLKLINNYMLNDEIINFYFQLLSSKRIYSMSSYFFERLSSHGYDGIKRWTQKINIFQKEIILIPIHIKPLHWALISIDFKGSKLHYFDSLGLNSARVECHLTLIRDWIQKQFLRIRTEQFDWTNWIIGFADKNLPLQQNGVDCGVFICEFAHRIVLNQPLCFPTAEIFSVRQRILTDILSLLPCKTRQRHW